MFLLIFYDLANIINGIGEHYKITQMQFMSALNGITKVYYLKI